jgi:acyl-CoA thioesterase I
MRRCHCIQAKKRSTSQRRIPDVILIDPQFAPKVLAKQEIEAMIDLIAMASQREHADLFHHFAIMRHWHEVAGMPFDAFLSADQLHMNDWSYRCLAKLLANSIVTQRAPRLWAGAVEHHGQGRKSCRPTDMAA